MNKKTLAYILIWLTTLIWGFGYIGVEDAIQGGWGTFPLIFARFLIAAIVLLPFSFKSKWWKNKGLVLEAALNGLVLFVAYVLQTIGQSMTSIANTSFLTVMWVVFIPIFLFISTKKKLEIKNYIGVVLAVVGAFVLCSSQDMTAINLGDVLVIGGAVCFAIQIIHLERVVLKYDALSVSVVQLFTVSLFGLLGTAFTSSWDGFGSGGYIGLIYIAVFSSSLGFLFQAYGQKYIAPTQVALIFSLESVVATIAAALIYQETINEHIIAGGILMLLATLIVQIDFKKEIK